MARIRHTRLGEPAADPFGERHRPRLRERFQVLGGKFLVETDSPELLRIARSAYEGLPRHKFAGIAPRFSVRLVLTRSTRSRAAGDEPPPVSALSADGLLCGALESATFVSIAPERRSALLVVTPAMLRFPYHVRYELLEFAVYVLAARAQRLVPLHGACVGRNGRGVLLLGETGAGKTTVALHCLLAGLDFLAEDSVLLDPRRGLATGIANYLHARQDSLQFLDRESRALLLGAATVIRRRSGVEKLEIDLRRLPYRLAPEPLRIGALVFLSPQRTGSRGLLTPISRTRSMREIERSQRYAVHQAGWSAFRRAAGKLPAFELRRGAHPMEAVEALKELLPVRSRRRAAKRSGR